MVQGDLKQFLIATNTNNGQELTIEPPDIPQKLSMCHQVRTLTSVSNLDSVGVKMLLIFL